MAKSPFSLEGKTAIVTGGGTGIGRAIALMLAAEGARVAVVGRRKEPLEQVVAEIERDKGVAVARNEQHRHLNPRQVLGPLDARFAGRVKRESEEGEAANPRQRLFRL